MAETIPLRYDCCCLFVCLLAEYFVFVYSFAKTLRLENSSLFLYFPVISHYYQSREKMCELDKKKQIKIYLQFTFFEMSFCDRLSDKQSNYKSALRTDRQALIALTKG